MDYRELLIKALVLSLETEGVVCIPYANDSQDLIDHNVSPEEFRELESLAVIARERYEAVWAQRRRERAGRIG